MRILITLASLALSLPVYAENLSTQEYTFNNGLKLLVRQDHRAPVATVQVWYKVGSGYEHNGTTGISHLVEHLQFKGTEKHPGNQFSTLISSAGGALNAFTSYDFTGYYENLPKSQIPMALELEADRMRNTQYNQSNFDTELQVVIEERRMRTDDVPESLTYERFAATALTNNPYRNPVIGWPDDLKTVTLNDVKQWYETWYAPNNATIVVVGDVDPNQIHDLVQNLFGNIKPSTLPAVKPQEEVKPLGEKQLIVKHAAKQPIVFMGLNVPVVKTANNLEDVAALSVLSTVLDGGESTRLTKHLVRDKPMASYVGAFYEPFMRMSNLMVFAAVPSKGITTDQISEALWQEVASLQTTPITEAELERAKIQYKSQNIYAKDSITDQASEMGSLESVGLSWKAKDVFLNAVDKVTAQQVQQVAQRYFSRDGLTIGVLEPLPLNARN